MGWRDLPLKGDSRGDGRVSFFNSHYDNACYLPMMAFVTFNDEAEQYLCAAVLLPGNVTAACAAVNWRGRYQYHLGTKMRIGCLYQMANRITHLYFFREVLGIDAWFVNLCFVDDRHCPTAQPEWELGLAEAKRNMGIATVPFAADVFLPAAG
jgi:hypothetical protein